jgi:membrane protein required for colicin V production
VKVSDKWLPIIAFILVFVAVVILIRLAARLIEKLAAAVMLGFLNRLGGIILYVAIYIMVFSVVLFYLGGAGIIRPGTLQSSVTYPFIKPWGPMAINTFAVIIPFFRDMFKELEQFFAGLSKKI